MKTPSTQQGEKKIWLSGYYPAEMTEPFEEWEKHWSMGPHAEVGWVWFDGEYTEKQARRRLKRPPKDTVLTSEYFDE